MEDYSKSFNIGSEAPRNFLMQEKIKTIREDFKKTEVVLKLNNSETKFNKRVLCLQNNILQYYSKMPHDFEVDRFDKLVNIAAKSGVRVDNIYQINKSEEIEKKKYEKKCYFSISFYPEFLIKFQKNKNKTPIDNSIMQSKKTVMFENPDNSKALKKKGDSKGKLITWVFSCAVDPKETSTIIDENQNKWLVLIQKNITLINNPSKNLDPEEEGSRKEEEKQREMQKKQKEEEKMKKFKEEEERRRRYKELENKSKEEEEIRRREEMDIKKRQEEEEMNKREEQQMEQELKKKDDENKRKKEQEQKIFEEKKQRVENAWEYRFFQIWDENILSLNSFEENMKKGLKMFHFLGMFKNKAMEITKEVIDSFVLPEQSRKYHPLQAKQPIPGNPLSEEYIYLINNPNFLIKLSFPEHSSLNDLNHSSIESYELNNTTIYSDKKVKAFSHEFRAFDLLADTLFLLKKKNKNFNIRVPLCSLIGYKGFRALVISQPPINGFDTLTVGPGPSGDYRFNQIIAQDLMSVANALNVKPHKFEWDPRMKSFPVILSLFTEVHQAKQEDWDELTAILIPNIPGADVDGKETKINLAVLTPGISNTPLGGSTSLGIAAAVNMVPLYYFMKVADVFPVDIDINSNDPSHFIKRLRPEFLNEHNIPLNADAFMIAVDSPESELDDMEVAEAGRKLREESLPFLLAQLEKLEVLPLDSYSMSQVP